MLDKKLLTKQYKETIQPMGIYQIKNLTNGKIFIGTSKNLHAKFNSSKFQLKMGSFPNKELQQDYTRCGEEQFSFEVLDNLKPNIDPAYDYTEDLKVLEEMWLEKLQPFGEHGYHKQK